MTIDPFCDSCLPATLSQAAERKVLQVSERRYFALILANIVFLAKQLIAGVKANNNGTPGFLSVSPNTTPTALADYPAAFVEIVNTSGLDLIIDRGAGTPSATLRNETSHVFKVASSTSELRLSFASGSATLDIVEYWGGLQ